ncbi:MAG: hypothetical protein ACK4WH_11480 [Phycisphaerales bacterium]
MKSAVLGVLAGALTASAAQAAVVGVGDSTSPWLGFMNVFELPSNGGAFVFASPWGVADLVATFDDANSNLTFSPNTIGDPNPFWYVGGGGPGAPGNKLMEANLYIETTDVLNGQNVTFQGSVISSSLTQAHQAFVFIRDFAPDYSSVVETIVPLGAGPFSISLATDPGAGRHVQYGFQMRGENVWVTDVGPFGNVMITTIPTPATAGLFALAGVAAASRRRVG